MTIAEIHGKISEQGTNLSDRMEDLLTSDIFGCLRYLPPHEALIPFLSTATSFHGHPLVPPDEVVTVHYSFWPWVELLGCKPCEPDIVIGLQTEKKCLYLIFIEAKYHSGLSSIEDENESPNDQLARELDNLDTVSSLNLRWSPDLTIISRYLLFVTQHMGIPRRLIAQSLAEYQRKRNRQGDIYWTSWRFLQPILEKNLKQENSPQNMAVMEDMLELLLRKGLSIFRGVDPITMRFNIPQFYIMPQKVYTWPMIPAKIGVSFEYEVKENGSE
jgi:hypothetical protein